MTALHYSFSRLVRGLPRHLGFVGAMAVAGVVTGCVEDGSGSDESADETGGHDSDHSHAGESEVITTVTLTFSPSDGSDPVVARFSDPDGDGGVSGTAEPIVLSSGTMYTLGLTFTNDLEDPPEDITAEIEEEAEEHQVFITGMGVSGPATGDDPAALVTYVYADTESQYGDNADGDDLPVGLSTTVTAAAAGTGTFSVQLQHLPELNGAPQKVPGLAEQLAAGTLLPGEADVQIEFELTVQ